MKELITSYNGNLAILGKRVKEYAQRTGCSNQVANQALWSQLFLDEMKKEHPGRNATCRQEWNLFLLERMFHNATTMWHKELQRHPCRFPLEPSETTWEHPSMWTLIGSKDANLLQVTEQIYKDGYVVAPSIFSCSQCDNLMKELWRELSEHLTWGGLQGERGPAETFFRIQRHSWEPQGEEDLALEAGPQGMQSQLRGRRTCSRGRSGSRWQQSPSPSTTRAGFSPLALCSLALMSSSIAPWKALSWNPGPRHSGKTLPHTEEKSGKQVWFEAKEELGAEPDLPVELVHFLAEGVPTSTESPQHSLALAGRAWPKIPAEQTTIPVIFITPHHHPSSKRGKSWEGINIDPNNTSLWVSVYLEKDS